MVPAEPYPLITLGDDERGYSTGYALRKGGNFNRKYYANGGGYTAAPCFRAVEALPLTTWRLPTSSTTQSTVQPTLTGAQYAHTCQCKPPNYNKTISLTDMNKEAENDWVPTAQAHC